MESQVNENRVRSYLLSSWSSSLPDFLCRPEEKQQLNVPEHTLAMIQKNLSALKEFLDRNPHIFHASPGDTTLNQEALKVNKRTFDYFWIADCEIGWAAFYNGAHKSSHSNHWRAVLCPPLEWLPYQWAYFQVSVLADTEIRILIRNFTYSCDKETQKIIAGLTLEDLITTQNGMTISRALVNVVIDQQSGQQISVGVLAQDVYLHLTLLIF